MKKAVNKLNKPTMCVREHVHDLKPLVKKLRDFIGRDPLSSTEAVNLVLEADAALR